MGVFYEAIPDSMISWIRAQKMFWVATAPLSARGHVNVSPKGGECFGVPDKHTFWYHDLTGSGNETISHLYENGRVTVMFHAFEGPPRIVRLYGTGSVLESGTPQFDAFVADHKIETVFGTRSIIRVDVHQAGSSCGFSVPFYDFKEFRPTLLEHFERKGEKYAAGNEKESMPRYWAFKNAWSIDNIPGMKIGLKTAAEESIAPMKKWKGLSPPKDFQEASAQGFTLVQLIFAMLFSASVSAILVLFADELLPGSLV
ncbi:hypothetical protein PG996_005510 [Apiospora saccharicola]|uniref:Pyridoxamine 5'-phosphate oxidase N-terminal domain-containing protein n=1 Tax=Apiospora saccharicola TaxID=335842 RepID=A0ABR1VLY8_9PEZI